jgi:hypothetical protein
MSESDNHWFRFFEAKKSEITVGPSYFRNLKELTNFMKEPIKKRLFYGRLFDFIKLLRTMVMNPKTTLIDCWGGPVPISNNCLTDLNLPQRETTDNHWVLFLFQVAAQHWFELATNVGGRGARVKSHYRLVLLLQMYFSQSG